MRKNRLTFRESQQVQGQLTDVETPAEQQVVTTAEIETAIEKQTGEPAEAEQVQQVAESLKRKGVRIVESRKRRFNQNQQGTQVATQEVVDQIIADQVITPEEIEGKVEEITGEQATPAQVQQIAESLKRKGFKVLESRKRRFNQNQQGQATAQQTAATQEITTDQIEAAIEAETEEAATPEQVQQIAESLKRRGAKIVESRKRSRMNESVSPLRIKKIKLFGA